MPLRRLIPLLALAAAVVAPAHAGEIFVSNERDNTLTVLDSASLKVVKTIAVGKRRAASSSPPTSPKCWSVTATATTSR